MHYKLQKGSPRSIVKEYLLYILLSDRIEFIRAVNISSSASHNPEGNPEIHLNSTGPPFHSCSDW